MGSPATTKDFEEDYSTPEYELYEDYDGDGVPHARESDDEPTPIPYDTYIGAKVVLPKGNDMVFGTVKSRVKDFEGQPIGKPDKNPIMDTRVYTVEFSDGEIAELGANFNAECMYAQCDIKGNQYRLMDHIVDHRKDSQAASKDNQEVTLNSKTYKQKTTGGWQLCIEWKDKSTSWERLSDMKESYPVEVAEYGEAMGITDEPALSLWTTHVLKKRQRIIAAVNNRYHKITNKFGIKVPKTVEEALTFNKENGNDLWWKAIQKEISAVKMAFKILDDDDKPPIGSKYMKCHTVF